MESLDPNEVWQNGNTFNNVIPRIGPACAGDSTPSLLPKNGGRAGVEYYLCSRDKSFEILNDSGSGWSKISGMESKMIIGPKGQVECELLSSGEPIKGTVDGSALNVMYLDESIPERTGLSSDTGLRQEAEVEPIPALVKDTKTKKTTVQNDPGPAPPE